MEIIYLLLVLILLYIVFVQEKIIDYKSIKESFNLKKTSWTRSKNDETYYRWRKSKNIPENKVVESPSAIMDNSSTPKEIDENLVIKGKLAVGKNIANYKLDVKDSIYAKEYCFKNKDYCGDGYVQIPGNFVNKTLHTKEKCSKHDYSRIPTNEELICYANRYPDLKNAFGYDLSRLREHWFKFAKKEKRNSNCSDVIENIDNCDNCAHICNKNPNCKSYQCSETEHKCYLNYSKNSPEKKDYRDYNFCIKDESGCKDDPSCPSPDQARDVCSRNDIVGEQARLRCPVVCKTGCSKKSKNRKFSEAKGGRNVCDEGIPLDNLADCKTAAQVRGKIFSGTVNSNTRPKGCFWDTNNNFYFNTGEGWGDKGGDMSYGRVCKDKKVDEDYVCLNQKDMRAVQLEPSNRELCIGDTCINKTDIGILKSMAYDKQEINVNSYQNCSHQNYCKRCPYPYFYERNYKDGRTYCYRTASNYKGMPNPVACTIGHDNPGISVGREQRIYVGSSGTRTKRIQLPCAGMVVSAEPVNKQQPGWKDTFRVQVSGRTLSVTRLDSNRGWGQDLILSSSYSPCGSGGKIFGTYVDGGSSPTVVKCRPDRWEKVFYKNPTNKINTAHDRLDDLRLKSRVKTNLGLQGDPTQSYRKISGNCTGNYDDYTFYSSDYGGQRYIHKIHGH